MKRDNARSPSRTDPAWAPSCASTSFSIPFRLSSFAWNASRAACCAARTRSSRLWITVGSVTPGTEMRNFCSSSVSMSARSHWPGSSNSAIRPSQPLDRHLDHPEGFRLQLLTALERELSQRIDHLALLVHHVVVLEQLLPRLEVLQLDALLGLADRAGDPRMGDDFSFLRAGAVHPASDAVRAEQAHQIVLEGEEEDALAGIALAPRAPA